MLTDKKGVRFILEDEHEAERQRATALRALGDPNWLRFVEAKLEEWPDDAAWQAVRRRLMGTPAGS